MTATKENRTSSAWLNLGAANGIAVSVQHVKVWFMNREATDVHSWTNPSLDCLTDVDGGPATASGRAERAARIWAANLGRRP